MTIALPTRSPFHLEATVRVLQRRPANLVDVWEAQGYRRVLATDGGRALVEVVNRGGVDDPKVSFTVLAGELSAPESREVERALRRVLGLDLDPGPLARRAESEPGLKAVAQALRGMRPPRFTGLFETIANVVPFQQVSLDAGVAVVRRLVERFGEHVEHEGRRYHAFPRAGAVASARIDAIRRCGLSHRKSETLRLVARAVEAGELSEGQLERLESAEAARLLTELPGIGPWSASLILLRGLGRLEVFPQGDVGVMRGLGELLHLPSRADFDRLVDGFGDCRGYLYFCSLGASLLARELIHPAPPRGDARSR